MTDDDKRALDLLEVEHNRVKQAVAEFRTAGVTAKLGAASPRVFCGPTNSIDPWPSSDIWFDGVDGTTLFVSFDLDRVEIYTINKVDGIDLGLRFRADTVTSAVMLAAENPDMRRWLGLA